MNNTIIDENILSVLELNKILDAAAKLAVSERTATNIRAMRPSSDVEKIRICLRETSEMSEAIRFGDPVPIQGIRDHSAVSAKLELEGAILEPVELLNTVAGSIATMHHPPWLTS